MEKLSSINPEITFYIRTAKKLGFIQKSKKPVLNSSQLKEMTQKKTKIPTESQILYYNGEQIKDNKNIKLVDKSIVHVVDSRNVGKNKMKLLVKRLPQNSPTSDFEVDSNTSIDEFIKKELEPFYEEPAEKLFFVYSGRQLKRQKSFKEEYVESETQIVCVHAEKDRKSKKQIVSARSSSNSLNSKETIETKSESTPKKQERFQTQNERKCETKVQHIFIERVNNKTQVVVRQSQLKRQNILNHTSTEQNIIKTAESEENQTHKQKKLIKSIEQIKCDQTESDEDSDNEGAVKEQNFYPQKLPEEYLMEQTRQRSNTKSDYNSGSSSISEANFKKKKKASEVDSIKGSQQKREEQVSPKSLHMNSSAEKDKYENEEVQKVEVETQKTKEQQKKYKTRDEIFESNLQTYSSVIDEPEQPVNYNKQEEEVYDSQMNYHQTGGSKIQVRGFMNFSSASFLEPSQVELNNEATYQNQETSFRETQNAVERNRRPEFVSSQVQYNQPYKQYSKQIGGDSLSFSKEHSEVKPVQESQDNLFVPYRRGPQSQQRSNNIIIRDDEVSESNLLSQNHTFNAPEIMNSFTFNLEPNPDEMQSHSKQSQVHIVDENEVDEANNIAYEKRESQIETNFRDSANPSQVYSHISSRIKHKPSDESIPVQLPSLIDELTSMIEYNINVNTIESQDSDEQQQNIQQNYVKPQSDISYDPQNEELVERHQQNIQSERTQNSKSENVFPEEDSHMFVSYQAYTTNIDSSLNNQLTEKKPEPLNQTESNLLEENSFGITHERTLQSGFFKKVLIDESPPNPQQYQSSAIKIIEDDSVAEQNHYEQVYPYHTIQEPQNNLHTEEMEQSAAFHEISQSINEKMQESSIFVHNTNNPEPYEITFRKYHQPQQSRFDERQGESKISQPQGSKLLYELSLQAINETEKPQLLPGDYIYSTDRIETPEEALDTILMGFAHCF